MAKKFSFNAKPIRALLILLSLVVLLLLALSSTQLATAQSFSGCSSQQVIPSSECEALVALYHSTNGPGWADNSGWLEDSDPCTWYGVFSCRRFGDSLYHVQTLWLNHNQLSGSIPPEIGSFPYLESINMEHNSLSGNIPPEIGNLANLLGLSLQGNQLTGSIPSEIGNLSKLNTLYVGDNPLSGELPVSMMQLDLYNFNIWGTCLIEPQDDNFQNWISSIFYYTPNTPRSDCPCLKPNGPILEQITTTARCGPAGKLYPQWGRVTPRKYYNGTLKFDLGGQLELWCEDGSNPNDDRDNFYALYYTSPDGAKTLVGMCPYEGGCNSALFYHSGDIYKNGAPDCLIGTRWISRDHLYNDVNSQDPLDPLNQFTGDEAPPFLLDWADFEFNSETQSREWKDVNWTYRLGPPVKPMCEDAEGGLVDINPVTPFLASGTETSVDNSTRPLSYEPTVMSPFKLCDFNSDGDCDVFDFQFFQGALGACEGDANYHPIADIDGDGCVTLGDQQDLFLVQPKGIYLPIVLKNTS